MPVAASRKQYRMMMAILHGKVKDGPRGRPPASIASKYTDPGKDAPESKDNDRGGSWTEHHHKRHAEKESKKKKKDLKKSFEEFYKNRNHFAATLVMDNMGKIMLGTHRKGGLAFPGGHVEPNETMETAALREMHEECGATGRLADKIWSGSVEGNQGTVFLAEIAAGSPKSTDEIKTWKWYELDEIPWGKLRGCCVPPLKDFIQKRFGKSIRGMVAMETLEKADKQDAVLEVAKSDALKLVGTGMFRHLKSAVADMTDEAFKEIDFDTYKISIRKHVNGVYSGRVSDGHKVIYQWTNKSLPELTAALMSVFEWYLPEDANVLDMVADEGIADDAIHGGLHNLVDNYKRHNLGEIYQEMETIREQMRNGMAVDLQQVEAKILKLFDRLEEATHELAGKHNKLVQEVGKDMDELEAKLRELQVKLEEPRKPRTVEAYSANPADSNKVHDRLYSYLTKPRVEISPNGKITISFGDDWEDLERSNFLEDMRARAIARK